MIIVMKKNPEKLFKVLEETEEQVTIQPLDEDGNPKGKSKSLKMITYRKSYKPLEGQLLKSPPELILSPTDAEAPPELPPHKQKLAEMSVMDRMPYTGSACGECGEPQKNTPSGVTCDNGHGGAPSKEDTPPVQEEAVERYPMRTYWLHDATDAIFTLAPNEPKPDHWSKEIVDRIDSVRYHEILRNSPDPTRYWHNPKTDQIFTTKNIDGTDPEISHELSEMEYAEFKKKRHSEVEFETIEFHENMSKGASGKPSLSLGWNSNPPAPPVQPEAPETPPEPTEPPAEQTEIGPVVWDLEPKETNKSSMREDRDKRLKEAKPFVPEPFFLRQSMLSSFLQCPDKFYEIYENGLVEESKFTKMGTAVHGVMEDYYTEGNTATVEELFEKWWAEHGAHEYGDFKDCLKMVKGYIERNPGKPNIIALEFEFRTSIDGVPVSGTIDRIDRVDDKTIRIIDYKSNYRPWTRAELEESMQFQMYTLAVMQDEIREQIGYFENVECVYEMLRLGYPQRTSFDQQTLEDFMLFMRATWTRMLSGVDRKPRFNQYCGYCAKKDVCPLYAEMMNAQVEPSENLVELTAQREQLKNQEKLIKVTLRDVDERILGEIASNNGTLEIGERVWSTTSSRRTSYPTDAVIRLLTMNGYSERFADLFTVNTAGLKKLMEEDPALKERIESVGVVNYTAPSLSNKKAKKKKE